MAEEPPELLEKIIAPVLVALLVASVGAGVITWARSDRNSEAIRELKAEFRKHTDQPAHKVLAGHK